MKYPEHKSPPSRMLGFSDFQREQMLYRLEAALINTGNKITILRDVITKDSYGGKERTTITVAEVDGLIDRANSNMPQTGIGKDQVDGNVDVISDIILYTPYRDDYRIMTRDYFFVNGMKHEIVYPKNNFNILWTSRLKIVLDEKESEVPFDEYEDEF